MTSRLEAAHIASVAWRAMMAASGSARGPGGGGGMVWRAGMPVGQRGPVGHCGGPAGVLTGGNGATGGAAGMAGAGGSGAGASGSGWAAPERTDVAQCQ